MTAAPAAIARRCVFCLRNGHLRDEQILARGEHLYLCAPRGQLVEGCLVIAPFHCFGCFARATPAQLDELARMRRLVERFYREAYGASRAGIAFYEQGRAGGGAEVDGDGGFPHHAHLCSLPVRVDLHALVAAGHAQVDAAALGDVHAPYVYVDSADGSAAGRRQALYVAATPAGWAALERLRLKPLVARSIGQPDRGDWRVHPGDDKLDSLIKRYRRYMDTSERRS